MELIEVTPEPEVLSYSFSRQVLGVFDATRGHFLSPKVFFGKKFFYLSDGRTLVCPCTFKGRIVKTFRFTRSFQVNYVSEISEKRLLVQVSTIYRPVVFIFEELKLVKTLKVNVEVTETLKLSSNSFLLKEFGQQVVNINLKLGQGTQMSEFSKYYIYQMKLIKSASSLKELALATQQGIVFFSQVDKHGVQDFQQLDMFFKGRSIEQFYQIRAELFCLILQDRFVYYPNYIFILNRRTGSANQVDVFKPGAKGETFAPACWKMLLHLNDKKMIYLLDEKASQALVVYDGSGDPKDPDKKAHLVSKSRKGDIVFYGSSLNTITKITMIFRYRVKVAT